MFVEQRDIRLCPRLRVISGKTPNDSRNHWVGILAPGHGGVSRHGIRHTQLAPSVGCHFASRVAFGSVVLVSVKKTREARDEMTLFNLPSVICQVERIMNINECMVITKKYYVYVLKIPILFFPGSKSTKAPCRCDVLFYTIINKPKEYIVCVCMVNICMVNT